MQHIIFNYSLYLYNYFFKMIKRKIQVKIIKIYYKKIPIFRTILKNLFY